MKYERWLRQIGQISWRMLLIVGLLLFLAGFPQRHARAAAIRLVKPGGAVTGACLIWINACSLWYAINISVAGDEIWVLKGTYNPYPSLSDRTRSVTLKNGVSIYGGFDGAEVQRSDRDPAANVTILSGEIGLATPADNSFHVVTGSGTDNTAVLDGFTITKGYANGINANENLGAGLFIDHGSPTLRNIIFSDHTATHGGAVYNLGGSPIFSQVSFINNTSMNNGGAVYNAAGAMPSFTNVTFSGGDAGGSGGGMYNNQSSPSLNNVTFNDNVATNAAGAMTNTNNSGPIITNSIFWNNHAASVDSEIVNQDTSTATVTNSVVEGGYAGTGNTDQDPLLGSLGLYGGSTQMYALLPGSSAIDAGNSCAAIDQRGISRPQGTTCDIGAYESRGFALALVSGDNQTTDSNTTFAQPLAVTISSSFSEPVEGGRIHFSAPASGAGASFSPVEVVIVSGGASTTATANGFGGSYLATAGASGVATPVFFHLTNIGPPGLLIFLPLVVK